MKNANLKTIAMTGLTFALAGLGLGLGLGLGMNSAYASVSNMAGTWTGTGTTYGLDGQVKGTYGVTLADTLQSDGSVAAEVTVAIPGQPSQQFEYLFEDTAKGFSMVSSQGSGGALCVDKGLCEGYFGSDSGDGVAITIIADDGGTSFRSLKTELKGFQAQSITLEKYVRVAN